jgi:hypothetical protein
MSIKTKKLGSELGISVAVLVMLALLIHPFWMPMGLIGLCVFVWRETPRDEREYVAVAQAGRSAYLVGGVLLTIGVTVQTLQHHVDIWLVLGLAGMVLAKVISTASKE